MAKELIAFFSRADENYVGGEIKRLLIGNTEVVAGIIQELTDADMFKIEPSVPYDENYNICIAQAHEDQKRNARPKLKAYPDDMQAYDVIYLGYPNYWSTMPMAVFTFLEHFDFTGKEIRPFCTHEGSGLGTSIHDIQMVCPNAVVKQGLSIYGRNAALSKQEAAAWLGRMR